jgi:oxygen-dependent protoporphyrinogen oxidase
MPRYTVGHAERVSEIEAGARTHPGLFLTGHSYRGVGIPDTIRAATETAAGVLEYISSNPVGSP